MTKEGVWTFQPRDWRDACFRLEMMELVARYSLDGRGPLKMRIVTPVTPPPVLLPPPPHELNSNAKALIAAVDPLTRISAGFR